MGTIIISTNVTLDGIVQDPDGQEGSVLGGWFNQFGGQDLKDWASVATHEAMTARALLLGRKSDQWFGSRWASRTGPWADRLNALPKYVLSSTLSKPVWQNSTVLRGGVAQEVATLKQKVDGEILVYASYQLGRALFANDLVDELRLTVFPVVLGGGARLFRDGDAKVPLRLLSTKPLGQGLVFYSYGVQRN